MEDERRYAVNNETQANLKSELARQKQPADYGVNQLKQKLTREQTAHLKGGASMASASPTSRTSGHPNPMDRDSGWTHNSQTSSE